MADTYTTNLNLTKPEPGAAEDTWGISLNSDLDTLDAIFSSSGTQINLNPNQVNFADNKKAIFGTGEDLEIYHDGSNSYIKDVGTGTLNLQGATQVLIGSATTGEVGLQFIEDGGVRLRHNNVTKFETTSTGIDVTGTVTSDGLTINNVESPMIELTDLSTGNELQIYADNSGGVIRTSTDDDLFLRTNSLNRIKLDNGGDISFYDDTGSTQGLFWDASAERLGIGNTAPNNTLDVTGNISLSGNVVVPTGKGLKSSGEFLNLESTRYLRYKKTGDSYNMLSIDGTADTITFSTTGSSDVVINNSGRLGIGTTAPTTTLDVRSAGNVDDSPAIFIEKEYYANNDVNGLQYGLKVNQKGGRYATQIGLHSEIIDAGGLFGKETYEGLSNVKSVGVFGKALASSTASQKSIGLWGVSNNPNMNYNVSIGVRGEATIATDSYQAAGSSNLQAATGGWFQAHGKWKSIGVHADAYLDASPETGATAIPLLVSSNTVEKMRVTADGDVGIGTTAPSQKLDVAGKIFLSGDAQHIYFGGNNTFIGERSNSTHLQLRGGGNSIAQTVFIDNNGQLGLGTATPSQKLTVEGNIELGTGGYIYGDTTTTSLRLSNSAGSQLSYGTGILSVAPSFTYSGGGSERFRVTDQGLVGIGTTNPTRTLDVNGDAALNGISFTASGATRAISTHSNSGQLQLNGGTSATGGAYINIAGDNYSSGDFISLSAANIYTTSANVGIGTSSPSAKLHIGGDTNSLGGTTGDEVTNLILHTDTSNTDQLIFNTTRTGTGTDWQTAAHKIQRKVDSTLMGYIRFGHHTAGDNISFGRNNVEYARFNVDGNLLVSKTSSSFSTAGVELASGGTAGKVQITRDGGSPLALARKTSDGDIAVFYKETAQVGSIGSSSGNRLYIGDGDTAIRFADDLDTIVPWNGSTNALRDNAIDLGEATGRFKDLHLSGQANVGTINNVGIKANETDFTGSILISDDGATGTLSSATSNTGLGSLVLANLTSGDSNVAVGRQALNSLTTGSNNTAVGRNALLNSTASNNVAVGYSALSANTTGGFNTAVGRDAGNDITTGTKNVALGYQALSGNTTGFANTAIGYDALVNIATHSNNTAVGVDALKTATNGPNTAVGAGALKLNTSGYDNTSVGMASLNNNTTGIRSVAVGASALNQNTEGQYNTGIGYQALYSNTTADNNTAVGYEAMKDNTTGIRNVAVGQQALANNTTANENTAVGVQALFLNTTGANNVAVGYDCLEANTTGNHNVAIGSWAMKENETGYSNIAIGRYALELNTAGANNVAIGYQALEANTTKSGLTAVGHQSLQKNTTGLYSVALGFRSLQDNTTGSSNTAVGYEAATNVTTGSQITAIGYGAADAITDAGSATAVGWNCLGNATVRGTGLGAYCLSALTTGANNSAFGYYAMNATTTGANNAAFGDAAMQQNTTGAGNVAVGRQSLQDNTTGNNITAVGLLALKNNETGNNNVGIGYKALFDNIDGDANVAIGHDALENATASDNTAIGKSAGDSITTGSNNTCIGFQADTATATSTNSITLGDANITSLRCNTQTISALSDARDKSNVEDLQLGVEFIKDLRPVSFTWDRRDGSQNGVEDFGFIAQELDAVQEKHNEAERLGLVLKDNPDKLEASYGKLVPMLVKAIQELSQEVEELKQKLGE